MGILIKKHIFIEFESNRYQLLKNIYEVIYVDEINFALCDWFKITFLSKEENVSDIGFDFLKLNKMFAFESYSKIPKFIHKEKEIKAKFGKTGKLVYLDGFFLPEKYENHNQIVIDCSYGELEYWSNQIKEKVTRKPLRLLSGRDEIIVMPTEKTLLNAYSN